MPLPGYSVADVAAGLLGRRPVSRASRIVPIGAAPTTRLVASRSDGMARNARRDASASRPGDARAPPDPRPGALVRARGAGCPRSRPPPLDRRARSTSAYRGRGVGLEARGVRERDQQGAVDPGDWIALVTAGDDVARPTGGFGADPPPVSGGGAGAAVAASARRSSASGTSPGDGEEARRCVDQGRRSEVAMPQAVGEP